MSYGGSSKSEICFKFYAPRVSRLEIVTTAERPELHDQFPDAFHAAWPELIFHDEVAKEYVGQVAKRFALYDVMVVEDGKLIAGGWGVPFAWSGAVGELPSGYDDALVLSISMNNEGTSPNTLSLMAIAVRPDHQGQGLAGVVISELRDRAVASGLTHVIAPVRPTMKAKYPLTTMEDFSKWLRADGLHLDPWIRTHQLLGARILSAASRSMVIVGTVSEWEEWTGMVFPQSGKYVVPDALDLVTIELGANIGTYIEPNLWMQHV